MVEIKVKLQTEEEKAERAILVNLLTRITRKAKSNLLFFRIVTETKDPSYLIFKNAAIYFFTENPKNIDYELILKGIPIENLTAKQIDNLIDYTSFETHQKKYQCISEILDFYINHLKNTKYHEHYERA